MTCSNLTHRYKHPREVYQTNNGDHFHYGAIGLGIIAMELGDEVECLYKKETGLKKSNGMSFSRMTTYKINLILQTGIQ